MSEAVTVPSLMMMNSIVSEESLARNTHTDTDRQTDMRSLRLTQNQMKFYVC